MFVLGLTGGIASGKSTVAQFFREAGAVVADADAIVREAQQNPEHPAFAEMKAFLGEAYFEAQGTLNRPLLREAVLAQPALLEGLEKIFHPVVFAYYEHFLARYQSQDVLVVLDVPLLLGSPTQKRCDAIAVTLCDISARRERAFSRSYMTENYWLFMLQRQASDDALQEAADYVIRTDVPLEATREQVQEIYREIMWRETV